MSAAVLALCAPVPGQARQANERSVDRLSGQQVAPVYDGYEVNPDGTYSMWFSYFNRNHAEHVEVPVGQGNRFEPGPLDRGQPTHFVPRWQKSVFRVVLPKDWGDRTLVWVLTSHGVTQQVTASLDRRAVIDRQKETLDGGAEGENLPPVVTVAPQTQAIARSGSATFTVSATDDGKPFNATKKGPDGMFVRWRKFRGPVGGRVSFSPAQAALVNGQSTAAATFSEPGEYVLQAVVDDGSLWSGTYCCWVNTDVKVTVR